MKLEAADQIERFRDFIESEYQKQLHELVTRGSKALVLDFSKLAEFDVELAEDLLAEPEEVLKAAELALEQFDLPEGHLLNRVRFRGLPESQKLKIANIRSIDLGKFVWIEGIVRQTSDVRPQVTSAKFECSGCGNTLSILQIDTKFKEPSRCTCGWRGRFKLLSQELIDVQHLKIEEAPENLHGGEQPKRISVILKEDLVDPAMEKKSAPGNRINIFGIITEVPITLKTGAKSVRYDLIVEANYVESVQEEFSDIILNKEDEDEIVEFAKDPTLLDKFVRAMAPSIWGHDEIKKAFVLQLFGGVRKVKPDGTANRGDIHILLVGDPGCIAGDSQIALYYKGMAQIQSLGEAHMQSIAEVVTKIKRDSQDKSYDIASTFQIYPSQPVLKIITETGKELVCTYNQPLLTRSGWTRADKLLEGAEIRVMPEVPNNVKKLVDTNFVELKKGMGGLKQTQVPKKVTQDLAALYGYLIGDGNIHPNGYRISFYVNEEEKELIKVLRKLLMKIFAVEPKLIVRNKLPQQRKINEKGKIRVINSKQPLYLLDVESKQIATCLQFLKTKRVPQQIFKSPRKVIAKFLAWLFEADGCCFGKGRGRTAIQLKSRNLGLLKDVQLLLLYFGIQSRIVEDNLCIRRSYDIEKYARYIGFISSKKKNKLEEVVKHVKTKYERIKRKTLQDYEKIVSVIPHGTRDVYDFEVPLSKQFVANGIVCHNSGKSQMLQFMSKAAPKARFVSGKGATGAGITASVVKDEFLKGWSLEAGALVLANKGLAVVDELDKMNPDDRSALHEALEQQTITISKANIQATLRAETTLLAAANPKLGRFDPYTPIASQIDLPSTLINRFDLIFPVRDIPSRERDTRIATHVLEGAHQKEIYDTEVKVDFLRRYIAYVKSKVFPIMSKSAVNEIRDFYVSLRNSGKETEEGVRPIPVSARQLEALIRLSEASARVRLAEQVTREDAKIAIDLLKHCLMQIGFDPETGQIDIDRLSTGITASTRGKIVTLKEIITALDAKGIKNIPIEEIVAEAATKGLEESKVFEIIDQLKRAGDVFEPRKGFIQKI